VKPPLRSFALVMLACVGCDHAAKQAASQWLDGAGVVSLLGGVVRLELVANPGAFLSLGAALPEAARTLLLVGLVPLLLAAGAWLALRSAGVSRAQLVAFGAMLGGGLANWLDRLANDGAVTDFVSIGFGPLRTGIFNLADVAIVAGLLLFLRTSRAEAKATGETS
jgi:signal peptidase II